MTKLLVAFYNTIFNNTDFSKSVHTDFFNSTISNKLSYSASGTTAAQTVKKKHCLKSRKTTVKLVKSFTQNLYNVQADLLALTHKNVLTYNNGQNEKDKYQLR